jgi:hypothetical protein
MGFLDLVKAPGTSPKSTAGPKPKTGSAFLDSVTLPTDTKGSEEIAMRRQQAAEAEQAYQDTTGFGNLFKNSVKFAYGKAKDYVVDSAKQAFDFEKNIVTHPIKTYRDVVGGFSDAIINAAQRGGTEGVDSVEQMLADHQNGTGSTAGDVANLARLTSGIAQVLFSPITGTFEGAKKIPLLKQGADAIGVPFTLADMGAAYGTGKVFDVIPDSYLSPEAKQTLKAPITELTTLAAEIFIGGKVMGKVADHIAQGRAVTQPEAQKIVDEVRTEYKDVYMENERPGPEWYQLDRFNEQPAQAQRASNVPYEDTPEYARSQGYEGYLSPEEMPVIEYGKPAASKLPTIKAEAPKGRSVPGDLVYEPLPGPDAARIRTQVINDIKADRPNLVAPDESLTLYTAKPEATATVKEGAKLFDDKAKITEEDGKVVVEVKVDPARLGYEGDGTFTAKTEVPVGTGEAKRSGLGESVERDAVAEDLAKQFSDVPMYQRMDMKLQADMALQLMKENMPLARDVAMGRAPSPNPELLPESVFTALRKQAREAGDVNTLRELATQSRLTSTATAYGQHIKALDSGQLVDPVSIIQDIKEARTNAYTRKKKGSVAKEKRENRRRYPHGDKEGGDVEQAADVGGVYSGDTMHLLIWPDFAYLKRPQRTSSKS